MKAITVKLMNWTATKPDRFKVSATGVKPITVNIESLDTNSVKSLNQQSAEILANKYNWLEYNSYTECEKVLRGGVVDEKTQCFVIVDIPFNARKSFPEFFEA